MARYKPPFLNFNFQGVAETPRTRMQSLHISSSFVECTYGSPLALWFSVQRDKLETCLCRVMSLHRRRVCLAATTAIVGVLTRFAPSLAVETARWNAAPLWMGQAASTSQDISHRPAATMASPSSGKHVSGSGHSIRRLTKDELEVAKGQLTAMERRILIDHGTGKARILFASSQKQLECLFSILCRKCNDISSVLPKQLK